jgi:predicted CDP-diglyceride synthetase/phosphatidate cytidylyltransferase
MVRKEPRAGAADALASYHTFLFTSNFTGFFSFLSAARAFVSLPHIHFGAVLLSFYLACTKSYFSHSIAFFPLFVTGKDHEEGGILQFRQGKH